MKRIFLIQVFILILFSFQPAYSDWSPDPEFGWYPRLYNEGTFQAVRDICLGICIAEDAEPGLDKNYSFFRARPFESSKMHELFEDRYFAKEEAYATVEINYPDKHNNPKSTVHLFLIKDFCVPDIDFEHQYIMFMGSDFLNAGTGMDYLLFNYEQVNEPCSVLSEISCNQMDLTEFYSWADKTKEEWGWEEDNDDEDDDDDNDTPTDEQDEEDDDDGCGCMISGQRSGLTTFLVMFLIGCLFLLFRKREIK